MTGQLLAGRREDVNRGLIVLYDVGTITGVVGGVAAIASTIWQLVQVWSTVWFEISAHAAQKGEVGGIVKRTLGVVDTSGAESMAAPSLTGLQPLVRHVLSEDPASVS